MSPLIRRLLAAAPRAWREDAPFRYAAIGFVIAAILWLGGLGRGGGSRPPATAPVVNSSDPLAPGAAPSASDPDTAPLTPGQSLDNVTVAPAPDAPTDRFGRPAAAPPPK